MRRCIAGLTCHATQLAAQGQEEQLPQGSRIKTDEGKALTGRSALRDEESANLPVAFVPHWRTCPNTAGFWREPFKPP